MKLIGGNTIGYIQTRTVTTDDIGEQLEDYVTVLQLNGFLDYLSGEENIRNYDSKLRESTHVFICDYMELNVAERDSRMLINNRIYEISRIDNPMELNQHLEIYLKYIGVM